MGPQLENGYTKIADAILENIAKAKLNGTQFRILMIVWRSTYGWGKKSFALSESYLSEATGIHKQQIKRELKAMIELGVLIETRAPTFNTPREIQFNKHYLNSLEVSNKIPVIEKDTPTGSEKDTPTGSELDTQNKHINKQSKKQIYEAVFEHYLSSDLYNHRVLTEDMKKAIDKATKELGFDIDYFKRIIDRHSEKVRTTKNKGKYSTKKRTLSELFGQKKHGGVSLVCTDYLDEVWEEQKKEIEFIDDNPFLNRG